MEDLTVSFLDDNILNTSVDSRHVSQDATCGFTKKNRKDRKFDLVNNFPSVQPEDLSRVRSESIDRDSSGNESNASQKLRRKSSRERRLDTITNADNIDKYSIDGRKTIRNTCTFKAVVVDDCLKKLSGTNDGNASVIEEKKTSRTTRVLRAVVIEDCMRKRKSLSKKELIATTTCIHDDNDASYNETSSATRSLAARTSSNVEKDDAGVCSKRRKNVSDLSGPIDLTENFSENFAKRLMAMSSKESTSLEPRNKSNLFIYSAKTEASLCQNDRKFGEDEKIVKLTNFRSPTRDARPGKLTKSATNEFSLLTPVIILNRIDAIESLNRDDVIEKLSETEITHCTNPVETMSSNRYPIDVSLQKSSLKRNTEGREHGHLSGISTSARFPIVSIERLVLGSSLSQSGFQTVKKWVSKSPLKNTNCLKNTWKMRVQFVPKLKMKFKARKSKLITVEKTWSELKESLKVCDKKAVEKRTGRDRRYLHRDGRLLCNGQLASGK